MDFAFEIIKWYSVNKRDLPWRHTQNPYLIWLSEIILQQTRVQQGLPYYEKFVNQFPTVERLAQATETQVLNLWQGLGYYSRARNLHLTAKNIVEYHKGEFPSAYNDLIQLKGIGPYTAAAIASFAVNEPFAVLDGNVFRVLARFFGITEAINSTKGLKVFKSLAQKLLPYALAGQYNQAIMEFGALQCKPQSPNCECCPINGACVAFVNKQVNELPVKLKKVKVKSRFFYYLIVADDDKVLMKRRLSDDIWKHLYDFLCIESENEIIDMEELEENFKSKYQIINSLGVIPFKLGVLHKLTHQNIFINFFAVSNTNFNFKNTSEINWVKKSELQEVPTPKPITEIIKKLL